jgi:hypothetical protein
LTDGQAGLCGSPKRFDREVIEVESPER